MIPLTRRQRVELETLLFFALPLSTYRTWRPGGLTITHGSGDPIAAYFAWSDRGVKQHAVRAPIRLSQLIDAKAWRSRNLEMYAEGIRTNDVPWFALVCDLPDPLAKWVIKETCHLLNRTDWDAIWLSLYPQREWWRYPP